MITRHPLILALHVTNDDACRLFLRGSRKRGQTPMLRATDTPGEFLVRLPRPEIVVADGSKAQCLDVAKKMFGAPLETNSEESLGSWIENGDGEYICQLQYASSVAHDRPIDVNRGILSDPSPESPPEGETEIDHDANS